MLGATDRIIYPYIIPMLLGRTFDIFKAHVGVDIFTQDNIRTPIRIHRSFVNSDFRLIRNDTEAKRYLILIFLLIETLEYERRNRFQEMNKYINTF